MMNQENKWKEKKRKEKKRKEKKRKEKQRNISDPRRKERGSHI